MPYAEVNHVTLYHEDAGDGPALLFLHGWGTSARVWGAQVAEFAGDHRVVTVDWRGCGRSARPATGNDIDTVVADLAELIEALRLDRPVVVGSSIGGVFATELGLRHPNLVGGVVPVDSPGFWPAQAMPLARIVADLRERRAAFLAEWVPNWYAPDTPRVLVDWSIAQILDSGTHIDGQITAVADYDPRPALGGLRVPIHYLHGELDAEIPVRVAEDCAARTPGARVNVIAGAGHMVQQERPAAFNAALRAALPRP